MGAVDVTIRIACGISQIQLMILTEINIIMDPRFIYAWKEFKVTVEKRGKIPIKIEKVFCLNKLFPYTKIKD